LIDLSPTPVKSLEQAYNIAKLQGLHYVTLGNTPGHSYSSTYCWKCNQVIIERKHIAVEKINIENGCCSNCGEPVAGSLYAADLLGGWLGGILISVILYPLIGLGGTLLVVGLIKVSSLVALQT
jgi:pyruvate formate lyase activating enzyme